MLVGRDVRPQSMILQHISQIPEIIQEYDQMVWELMEEFQVSTPGELLERFQERVQSYSPPPISAEQWARAAFRVADWGLSAAIAQSIEDSQRREQAASSLLAAMLTRHPIEELPVEASRLIAVATGTEELPPPIESRRMTKNSFFLWFQALHHELRPDEPDLTEEELSEYWNDTLSE